MFTSIFLHKKTVIPRIGMLTLSCLLLKLNFNCQSLSIDLNKKLERQEPKFRARFHSL